MNIISTKLVKNIKLSMITVLSLSLFVGCNDNNDANNNSLAISTAINDIDCSTFDTNRTDVECKRLEVPNDYFAPTTNYSMPIYIKKANNDLNLAPIIFINGGPGSSAVNMMDSILDYTLSNITDRDIISFDARGTGYFEPYLECNDREVNNNEKISDTFNMLYEKFNATQHTLTEELYDTYLHDLVKEDRYSCVAYLKEKGSAPENFSSSHVAYDLESLRQSLGYEKIILIGISYGTRFGLEYMELFPQNLEATILDALVPENTDRLTEEIISRKKGIQRFMKACEDDELCSSIYPNLEEKFLYIINKLHKNPYCYTDESTNEEYCVDGNKMSAKIFGLLYYSEEYDYKYIPEHIQSIYLGLIENDYTRLKTIWPYYTSIKIVNDGKSTTSSPLMRSVILRNDYPFYLEKALYYYDTLGEYAPSIDKYTIFYLNDKHKTYSRRENIIEHKYNNNVPTLLLSGTLDPVTPPENGENLHQRLNNSTHIVIENGTHGQTQSPCGKEIVDAFLKNPENFDIPQCAYEKKPI